MKTIVLIASCLFTVSVMAQDSKTAKSENKDKFSGTSVTDDTKFVVEAAEGGMAEVKLGQLAQTKASSQKVKDLARMMVTDHSKANEELKALAKKKNITIPSEIGKKYQEMYDDLNKKSGEDFDKAYSKMMKKDHKDDIDKFEKEANKGNDKEIAAWASGKLPTLKHHLEMAEEACKAVKAED